MPRGIYQRGPGPTYCERNTSSEYLAWREQRRQENRAARVIRSEAIRQRAEIVTALAAFNAGNDPSKECPS